ncbi:adenine deaminase [Desulfovibrio sulfodismutans]|uniref:Adenine deaminase n=1 Tax=Desulfolutivibrio sulfodismutans TaxID=63561 RepID=A0A7K3NNW6_9BACT|nr:adenine deaminase [Desulfolutivibrio sulfodismutans]NDY57892.1 adenine deaminase [Desulfolutivibrio sulfodismutans]QLA11393.1 adenine deaminase [Desulfolutivibrio sulfodismutans DSM 3696]
MDKPPFDDVARLTRRISLALGETPADLLITGCQLVNVLSGEIHAASVAVADGVVLGFGDYPAREVVDAGGRFLCPGFLDGHIHIESTLLSPPEFARAVAPHGTCAVVCDPHEIANVMGPAGIEYMLAASRNLPLTFYVMMSSCVPATHMETSGAAITPQDIRRMLAADYPFADQMLGLAEVMNYPGVLARDPLMLAKIAAARGRVVDGHAPLLTGKRLNAYILAGPGSDHECTRLEEAREKLRKGMQVMIREGSTEQNLADLAPLVTPENAWRFSLVSDDRDPVDIKKHGHMNELVRRAVAHGISPVAAVAMASINTARYFRLPGRGAVAPGYRADLVLVDDLETFAVSRVWLGGRDVRDLNLACREVPVPNNTMRPAQVTPETFRIPAKPGRVRVIGLVPGQIVTRGLTLEPRLADGLALADPGRDLAKLAVIERHHATGNVGLGFVQGLGLAAGAIAGTVSHDSHNLIVAGVNDADMAFAAQTLTKVGGGFCVVKDGRILAVVELPVAGLMSAGCLDELEKSLAYLGGAYASVSAPGKADAHPFMSMSFLSLAVIPELKLTDKGLVDVESFSLIDLFVAES